MKDYSDLAVAAESLSDPATSASDLALIAEYQPSLHSGVAMHPAAYGDLLDWLDEQGNPQLSRIVIQRRSTAKDLASSATAFSQVADDSTMFSFLSVPMTRRSVMR